MSYVIHKNPHASKMVQCYEQSGAWADGSVLIKHERELDKAYSRRKELFCSPAIYSYLVDGYSCLFGQEPARDAQGSKTITDQLFLGGFVYSSGMGLPLSSVLQIALKRAMICGASFVVMDSMADQPASLEDAIAERAYPFVEIVNSYDVQELTLDRTGTLQAFAYRYQRGGAYYTRRYTPFLCTDTGKPGESQSYQLPVRMPVIPVSPVHPLLSGELPPSPTLSLYQCQVGIANTLSLSSEEMQQTCFPLLIVNSAAAPGKSSALGVSNGLHLQVGESASYLSPASNTLDSKLVYVEKLIALMIRTQLNLLSSGEAQSGVAKQLDRSQNVGGLRALASYLEKVEYCIYEAFCGFLGVSPNPEFKVRYTKNFDAQSIAEWLASALDVLNLDISDQTKGAVRKEIVSRLFPEDEVLVATLLQAEEQHTPSKPGELDAVGDAE